MNYYVYILACRPGGALYIGVTNNLVKRVWEHKNNLAESFTKKYHIHTLIYFEQYATPQQAITREKQLKKWNRSWKANLIAKHNPTWEDLYETLT
jgi:putative endonuclease